MTDQSSRADRMAMAVASGKTTCEVSREHGVTVQAVQNACRRRGIKSKWPRGKPTKKYHSNREDGK